MNEYLNSRNKKYYRGSTKITHPLYDIELGNAIDAIKIFLDKSILEKARVLREKTLYTISLEKCWNHNNYSFSEANECNKMLFDSDSVLKNIENFKKEMEVNILSDYEDKINLENKNIYKENSKAQIGEPSRILNEKQLEVAHRKFLVNVHLYQRFYYFYLAKYLFIDKLAH